MALQIPLERSCTINWIIRLVDDELFGAVCQLQRNLFCLQPLLQILHQQVDDAADVLAAQRFIKDDFVQTVEELRSEAGFQQRVDLILCLLADFAVRRDALQNIGGTQVGGQDDDGVFKIHRASLRIGDSAVIQHLKQDVKYIRVRLFHLVEQNDRIRSAANGFGQLAALLIADIARRRSNQSGYRILLHIFAHINADHVVFVIEQGLCQGFCQLGFTHTGRTQEEEGTDWTVRVGDACPRAQNRFTDQAHRFVLSHYVLVQDVFHVQQFFPFALHDFGNRDAGPFADHLGDFLLGDLVPQQAGLLGFLCQLFFLFQLRFQLRQFAVFQFGCLV